MQTLARIILALNLLLPLTAQADEGHDHADGSGVAPDVVAGYVGKALPGELRAAVQDITATFSFDKPTKVGALALGLEVAEGEVVDTEAFIFERGGKIVGVELIYMPDDSDVFGSLPFEEQRARFDAMYGFIADNYSGSDLGEMLIYDDTGGLYQWQDQAGVWWTLSWTPDIELSLSLDLTNFRDEHSIDLMNRTAEAAAPMS